MTTRVAILQSNYIPWRGYFDLIRAVDFFVFYDDVQYTKNDWRNRNKIKTQQGIQWLSIPAGSDLSRKINEVEVSDQSWKAKHRRAIEMNYRKAAHFDEFDDLLDILYDNSTTNLSEYNQAAILAVAKVLGCTTTFVDSRELGIDGGKTERLVEIVAELGGTDYLSGPAARSYIDCEAFDARSIGLHFVDYDGYPQYEQLYGEFEPFVSVLDLLFNTGSGAVDFMKDLR